MTDIMHMLQQAQAQAHKAQNKEQNDSVASFFSSLQSTNQTRHQQSMPIPIKSNQSFTLESIERNIPKISPPPPNHDTQASTGSQQQNQDLMANSPLAQFISSNNLNALRGPLQEATTTNGSSQVVPGLKALTPQQQPPPPQAKPIANGAKLITPNMLTNGSSSSSSKGERKQPQQQQQPGPLTKNQLLQAFKYLIDNDNDFTKKIHDAYLKSVNSNS